jgi:hypothetical protein
MTSLITVLKKHRAEDIFIEIIDEASLVYYKNIGFPDDILTILSENLQKKKNSEKTMKFYGDFF